MENVIEYNKYSPDGLNYYTHSHYHYDYYYYHYD